MVDLYAIVLEMVAAGKQAFEIATATGWPAEAVEALQQELGMTTSHSRDYQGTT